MTSSPLSLALALALGLVSASAVAADRPAGKAQLGDFGVDLGARDLTVKPGDDFNRHVSGTWLKTYELKDYETSYGSFNALRDRAEEQVHALIEDLQRRSDLAPGSNGQKVRDFYASYMDRTARDAAGIAPLRPVLERIAAIDTKGGLIAAFANADLDASASPVRLGVDLDRKNPDQYLVSLNVGGLGLPDKDYYVNPDARFVAIREAYVAHIQRMLGFAGAASGDAGDLAARAQRVLALETALAKPQWERAKRRDRDKTYNVVAFAELRKRFPSYDFAAHLKAQQMPQPDRVNVVTPDAVQPVLDTIAATDLAVWRDYLAFHAIDGNAELLSRQIDNASFEFNGKVIGGQKAQKDDWKRAVALVGAKDAGLGDAVGELYVARWFKPESKAAMDSLVENLRAALRQNIQGLDWMGEATKAEAYRKLSTFRPKIGYPSKWTDYSSVTIVPGDLVANAVAMRRFERMDENRRVGRKTDRDEWRMTPQTVNAYYNSTFNEIVFPGGDPAAAVLRRERRCGGELRRHRRGDRPRDGPRFRRPGQQVRLRGRAAQLVDRRRPRALRGAHARIGRAVRQLLPAAGPVRQRRADDGREHRRPGRHLDGVHGLPAEPARQPGRR